MPQEPALLPHYDNPPVIEVVTGVQFDELPGFLSVHFGSFWEFVKSEYPKVEDRPPLPSIFEEKPSQDPGLELLDLPPLRRAFLVTSAKNYLLQVQSTRFLHNWRRIRPNDAYPRFVSAEERFLKAWDAFRHFAETHSLGNLRTNQYELTYINHVFDKGSTFPADIHQFTPIFTWSKDRSNTFLPEPASLGIDLKFKLPEKRGTLHVSMKHGKRLPDGVEILIVELTARGPALSDASDMREWFSIAHEWIVRGFTDLTTTSAHERWGRTR